MATSIEPGAVNVAAKQLCDPEWLLLCQYVSQRLTLLSDKDLLGPADGHQPLTLPARLPHRLEHLTEPESLELAASLSHPKLYRVLLGIGRTASQLQPLRLGWM
ncbi:MAG: hypothetical protein ABFE08_03615 [Armatimonadia bacterium]